MELFESKEVTKLKIKAHNFHFIIYNIKEHVLTITLNRPNKKNALHPQMINEIALIMEYAKIAKNIRAIIIEAKGDVFCSGMDLKAIKGEIEPNNSTIPKPKKEILIAELFNKCYKPIISKVTGNVYAGGYLLIASSTYVVALNNLKFGLPEVKRGLFPMQVMASLLRIIPARKVLNWCLSGYTIDAKKAKKWGLISKLASHSNINKVVKKWVDNIKENSPKAISLGIEAYDYILDDSKKHKYLLKMLQKNIKSKDAKEGMASFIEKRKPNWTND